MITDPFLNKVIKDYKIVKKIGKGTFGAVYQAQHVRLSKKLFAIKILHPHIATEKEIVERFRREAESLALLSHPNIVQIIDFDFLENIGYFLVMEWLNGITLKKYLKEKTRISLKETEEIFLQLMRGLGEAHRNQIVHRDLKPANIMLIPLEDSLSVKILDFGIAALKDNHDITEEGIAMGSANYISPEQAMGQVKEIDGRSDLYSCGIIFAKCITGKNVFSGKSSAEVIIKHISVPPPKLNELYPEGNFSEELESFYQRSIHKDKEKRFQTAREFASEMKRAIESSRGEKLSGTREKSPTARITSIPPKYGTIGRDVVRRAVVIHPGEGEDDGLHPSTAVGSRESGSYSSLAGLNFDSFSSLSAASISGRESLRPGKATPPDRAKTSIEGRGDIPIVGRESSISTISPAQRELRKLTSDYSKGEGGTFGESSTLQSVKRRASLEEPRETTEESRSFFSPISPFEMVTSKELEGVGGGDGGEKDSATKKGASGKIWMAIIGMIAIVSIGGGLTFLWGSKSERKAERPEVPAEPRNYSAGPIDKCPNKGGEMAKIPAGPVWVKLEGGLKKVDLYTFCIDKREVTIGEYRKCRESGVCREIEIPAGIMVKGRVLSSPLPVEKLYPSNYPMTFVSWSDARKFCLWAGKRLPREIEWERAVRGSEKKPYPWGEEPLTCRRAISAECSKGQPMPVGSAADGTTPSGVADLLGNAAEWMEDCYLLERKAPFLPFQKDCTFRTIKGGSFLDPRESELFNSFERKGAPAGDGFRFIGFRCAYSHR